MRINVDVDDFNWKYLGVIASLKGIKKKEALEEALRDYLVKNWEMVQKQKIEKDKEEIKQ